MLRDSEWRLVQLIAREAGGPHWPVRGWGGLYRRLHRRGLIERHELPGVTGAVRLTAAGWARLPAEIAARSRHRRPL